MNGSKGEVRIEEPTRAQRTIARRAAESRATVPHLELSTDVAAPPGGSPIATVVKASALALREVPRANASYRDGRFELYSRINVGLVVATEDAFAIPTLFDADTKTEDELAAEIEALSRRAQTGQLLAPELSGATFTVFELRAHRGAPVIVPPQAAALGVGLAREVPVARAGAIVPQQMITITIACDHRILYGSDAAGFLAAVARALEDPRPL